MKKKKKEMCWFYIFASHICILLIRQSPKDFVVFFLSEAFQVNSFILLYNLYLVFQIEILFHIYWNYESKSCEIRGREVDIFCVIDWFFRYAKT